MGWELDDPNARHSPPSGSNTEIERIVRSLQSTTFADHHVLKISYDPKPVTEGRFPFKYLKDLPQEWLEAPFYYIIPLKFFRTKEYRNKKGVVKKHGRYFLQAFKLASGYELFTAYENGDYHMLEGASLLDSIRYAWWDDDKTASKYIGLRNYEIEKIMSVKRLGVEEEDENFYQDFLITLATLINGGIGGDMNLIIEILYSWGYNDPLTPFQSIFLYETNFERNIEVDEHNINNYFR